MDEIAFWSFHCTCAMQGPTGQNENCCKNMKIFFKMSKFIIQTLETGFRNLEKGNNPQMKFLVKLVCVFFFKMSKQVLKILRRKDRKIEFPSHDLATLWCGCGTIERIISENPSVWNAWAHWATTTDTSWLIRRQWLGCCWMRKTVSDVHWFHLLLRPTILSVP